MRFVEEIVVDDFLPTFRSLLAEALREEGFTQSEVADLLGLSQSAVSKYVHGEVDGNEALLADERLREHVDVLADGLASGDVSPVQALVETEVLIRELERGGTLARLHEDAVPALAEYDGTYAVHDPEGGLRAAERTLGDVRRGLRTLETTSGFTTLIPAVGSNLVQAVPDAETIEDVAAVPGRILDVKGRATIPAEPEFGVSEHVATLLLEARGAGADAGAALNLRYDPDLLADLEAVGHATVPFDPEGDVATAVTEALADEAPTDRAPTDEERGDEGQDGERRDGDSGTLDVDVLYHAGGFGIEPIIYLLGPDAPTVAATVRELV